MLYMSLDQFQNPLVNYFYNDRFSEMNKAFEDSLKNVITNSDRIKGMQNDIISLSKDQRISINCIAKQSFP